MSTVKIMVDLSEGKIEIEAPQEALEDVFSQVEKFLPKLTSGVKGRREAPKSQKTQDINSSKTPDGPKMTSGTKTKKKQSSGKKRETYVAVNNLLDSEDERKIAEFFKEKSPTVQNDQVLVVAYWLKINKNIDKVTPDHVYTGLKAVGGSARIPARIASVISNLCIEGLMVREDGMVRLHHTGEDFVEKDLPENAGD